MPRSLWKGPYSVVAPGGGRTQSRASMVLARHVDHAYRVYNGRTWVMVRAVPDMVGHRFGEFSPTRRGARHRTPSRRPSR